jgi:hypothetical protein
MTSAGPTEYHATAWPPRKEEYGADEIPLRPFRGTLRENRLREYRKPPCSLLPVVPEDKDGSEAAAIKHFKNLRKERRMPVRRTGASLRSAEAEGKCPVETARTTPASRPLKLPLRTWACMDFIFFEQNDNR